MPTACPATPTLPASSVVIAILKPWPSCPSRFSLGTRHSSKVTVAVEVARIPRRRSDYGRGMKQHLPSLSSFLPRLTPGARMSTMKAEMPLCLSERSVVAKTMP